jgi:hypothetical protein
MRASALLTEPLVVAAARRMVALRGGDRRADTDGHDHDRGECGQVQAAEELHG